MEVSMRMNRSLAQKCDKHKLFSFPKNPRKNISCTLAMQNGIQTDFYQLLSLSSQHVGYDEIKRAYKSMALQYHPDVCTAPLTKAESTQRFIELRKAYETLSDPKSRQIYDFELALDKSKETDFPRKVWERQLHGLKKRCDERIKQRRCQESI